MKDAYDNCFHLILDDGRYIADRETRTYWRDRSTRFGTPEFIMLPDGSYKSTVGSIGALLFGTPSCLWGFTLVERSTIIYGDKHKKGE